MKKVTYIVSDIDKAFAFEWITNNLDIDQIELSFILLNPGASQLEDFLKNKDIPCYVISTKNKGKFKLLLSVLKCLRKIKPDVVHCHMRLAKITGIIAAKILGIKKRIYTRHNSTYNAMYYPHSVKIDKFINRLSTDIIAISEVVRDVLIKDEDVSMNKVHLIHHGFDLDMFSNIDPLLKKRLNEKYNPNNRSPVIGMIGRYMPLKGHLYLINAFLKVLKTNPNALLILAGAKGPAVSEIKAALAELPEDSYCEIEFENDVFALYHLFDVFVHIPIDKRIEAFGQTYIEALAAGVPSVFTLSGVANEFIEDKKNAIVVPYKDADAIHQAIMRILQDQELADRLVANGKESTKSFGLKSFIDKLNHLYLS